MGGLVAVTFTEKAAGELKLRLRQELENERAAPAAGGRARGARGGAAQPRGGADQHHPRLLRRPAQGISGRGRRRSAVRRADRGSGAAALRRGVCFVVPGRARGDARRRAPLAPALEPAPSAASADADGPVDRLRAAGWQLTEWRDFPASWTRPEFERTAEIDRLTTLRADVRGDHTRSRQPARSVVSRHRTGAARQRRAADAHRGRRSRRRRGAVDRLVEGSRLPPCPQRLRAELRQGAHADR